MGSNASASQAMELEEVARMLSPCGFDVIIVCCSNQAAENYWQARLEQTVVQVTGTNAKVVAVHEDWNGGAGNGLGTLYAYQKARDKASRDGFDLDAKLSGGASVALFHTAGKGTRLAPLPGAENNNKPGVKLPSLLEVGGAAQPLTVLEAVMRQTSSYAPLRGGRISVFWGDQVFVPSAGIQPSTHPADILAALRPMPSKAEWEAGQLHQYGLIAVGTAGDATQLEKALPHPRRSRDASETLPRHIRDTSGTLPRPLQIPHSPATRTATRTLRPLSGYLTPRSLLALPAGPTCPHVLHLPNGRGSTSQTPSQLLGRKERHVA